MHTLRREIDSSSADFMHTYFVFCRIFADLMQIKSVHCRIVADSMHMLRRANQCHSIVAARRPGPAGGGGRRPPVRCPAASPGKAKRRPGKAKRRPGKVKRRPEKAKRWPERQNGGPERRIGGSGRRSVGLGRQSGGGAAREGEAVRLSALEVLMRFRSRFLFLSRHALLEPVKTADIHSIQSKSTLKTGLRVKLKF